MPRRTTDRPEPRRTATFQKFTNFKRQSQIAVMEVMALTLVQILM
jgi:hypothetical protein